MGYIVSSDAYQQSLITVSSSFVMLGEVGGKQQFAFSTVNRLNQITTKLHLMWIWYCNLD
jgi:hypothetical protein